MRHDDHEGQVWSFVAGMMLGAMIGAGAALLTAPEKGRKTRKKLVRAAGDARDTAQGRLEEFADDVRERVDGAVETARRRIGR